MLKKLALSVAMVALTFAGSSAVAGHDSLFLTAPNSATVVSPLTTLLVSIVNLTDPNMWELLKSENPGLTGDQVGVKVLEALRERGVIDAGTLEMMTKAIQYELLGVERGDLIVFLADIKNGPAPIPVDENGKRLSAAALVARDSSLANLASLFPSGVLTPRQLGSVVMSMVNGSDQDEGGRALSSIRDSLQRAITARNQAEAGD